MEPGAKNSEIKTSWFLKSEVIRQKTWNPEPETNNPKAGMLLGFLLKNAPAPTMLLDSTKLSTRKKTGKIRGGELEPGTQNKQPETGF